MSEAKKELLRSIKFTLFSISAGVIQLLVDTLLLEVCHLVPWVSYLIALVASVLWNFTLNRKFTFHSAANVPIAMLKVAGFYVVFTPLSGWWGKALTDIGWNGDLVMIGTMLINFVTEFLYQKFVVYRGMIDTNDVAKRAKEKENVQGRLPVCPCGGEP